jgi:hypothetical protein
MYRNTSEINEKDLGNNDKWKKTINARGTEKFKDTKGVIRRL